MQVSINKIEKVNVQNVGEIIVAFGRDKSKKKVIKKIHGHSPYFYVSQDQVVPSHRFIVSTEDNYESVFHEKLRKIVTINSDNVPEVRKIFNMKYCYEDDVLYKLRWLIDTKIKNGAEFTTDSDSIHYTDVKPVDFFVTPRRLHVDIEVKVGTDNRLPDYQNPVQPITAISNIDSYAKSIITFTIKKDINLKLLKKLRVSTIKVLYSEETSTITQKVLELVTEVGTKYKWTIFYFKNDVLVSFDDSTLKKVVNKETVEITMLNTYINYFCKVSPDFYCGWNIEHFDLPYIIFRMKYLGINYKKLSPINKVWMEYDKSSRLKHIEIGGVIVFDTMVFYLKMHTHKVSGALNDAANKKLGYGKIKYTGSLDNLQENDLDTFLKYNATDVVMEYEIFEKMNMIGFYGGLKQYIGCPYELMQHNSKIIDFYLLSKAKLAGYVLPSSRENKRLALEMKLKKGKYSGGYVAVPAKRGRSFYVLDIDLKSLYPMIMITWNLGNDTLLNSKYDITSENICTTPELPDNKGSFKYRTDILSFVSTCLKELVDYRDKLKHQLFIMKSNKDKYSKHEIDLLNDIQQVVKFITNTIYGVLGHPNFRLFELLIAECITTIGRMIIKDTVSYVDGLKILTLILSVFYTDTDSAIVNLIKQYSDLDTIPKKGKDIFIGLFNKKCPEDTKDKFTEQEKLLVGISYYVTGKLNELYKKYNELFNVKNNYLSIKPEHISSVYFTVNRKSSDIVAKKRYAERIKIEFVEDKPIKVDKVEIKGFVKSNMSEVGNKCFEDVLNFTCVEESDEVVRQNISKYVMEILDNIRQSKYKFLDLCKREGMNQQIDTYENEEHVRAARWANENAKYWGGMANYGKGSTVKYIYVIPSKIPKPYSRTDVVAVDNNNYIPEQFMEYVNKTKLMNKTVLEPLSEIFAGMGIKVKYLKTGKMEKKLWS